MKRYLTLILTLVLATPVLAEKPAKARNVILFVGDGMGISTLTAARIHAGQLAGKPGEEHDLSWDRFENVALVKTFNVDRQVPDSAGTMSAIVTGQPGRYGVISIDPAIERGDCPGALTGAIPTLLERAEQAGLRTGVVTTTHVTHATPAATFAHSIDRSWESDADLTPEARAAGCIDIARQLVEFDHGDGIEVILGGGRQNFMPLSESDPEYPTARGRRMDGRHLVNDWLAAADGRRYVWNLQQFEQLDPTEQGSVLGLFEPGHMHYEVDRRADVDGPDEPDLAQLTEFAIRHLQHGETGFFLMVEGGRIDHAHHDGKAGRALTDTLMMDQAVARALDLTDAADTLILVTADHSHTLTISGYPPRGNPILGKVPVDVEEGVPDIFKRPYTTLGYQNGPGFRAGTPDLTNVDTTDPEYRQHSGWPLASETHGGEDVAAFATGPGAERLRGVIEQRRLYDVMAAALFSQ